MTKGFIVLNIVLILAVLVGDFCYMEYGGLLLKGLTSLGFVLLGAANLLYAAVGKKAELSFPAIMVTALVLAMVGDIAININFIWGALFFAVGHLFFFLAFCRRLPLRWHDFIPVALIFLISAAIVTLVPVFEFGGTFMKMLCIGYALVISLMAGKAFSNFLCERNSANVIMMIGCFLFYFSDLMLLFDQFSDVWNFAGEMCLLTYYPAQCLLGFSIFAYVNGK